MFKNLKLFWLFVLTQIFITAGSAHAFDPTAHLQAEIVSKQETLHASEPFEIGVAFRIDPGWHIYWDNAGDSGYKTSIEWTFDKKVKILKENVTPTPEVFNSDGIVDYGFKRNVLYSTTAQLEDDPKAFSIFVEADIKYLICKDICLPGETKISKAFTLGTDNEPSINAGMFLIQEERLAKEDESLTISSIVEGEKYKILIDGLNAPENIHFIPQHEGLIVDSAEQTLSTSGTATVLSITKDTKSKKEFTELEGILNIDEKQFVIVKTTPEFKQEITVTLPTEVSPTEVKTYTVEEVKTDKTLQLTLLFAFLGGLVLNLMPCVLPVLSLKALSLLHHANHKLSWWYGLVYTAGIMATFIGFAFIMVFFKQNGHEVGWGFQLQSPVFVATLSLIIMMVGLQLSGVFHIGTSLGRLQNLVSGHGTISTLFSGMLITLVATPCTAPFMAAAVAFALTQPSEITYLTFGAMGLGLAFPYLAMTFMPFLLRLLPKPGAWEITFQNFLAFPMYATVLWLVWVYGQQTSMIDLFKLIIALFVVSFGVWVFGKTNVLSARFIKKIVGYLFLIASLLYFYFNAGVFDEYVKKYIPQSNINIEWNDWSIHEVEKGLSQGRPVFVNFTADWCITCKVNELTTFKSEAAAKFVESKGILMLKADWTMKDENIRKELQKHGRYGVPLYLMYTPINPAKPKVLEQVLTLDKFKKSL